MTLRISSRKEVDRYHIYVGLNHAKTLLQRFDTQKYVSVVDYICKNNGISYTLNTARGGYRMENGVFINENSLDIMLVNAKSETVDELASELCALIGQECVLVLHDKAEMYYLSEGLE